MDLYTREEIEEIFIMERLNLYNRGLYYGAQAISRVLDQKGFDLCLPSVPSTASSPEIVSHIAAQVIILRAILGSDYGMVSQAQCGSLYSR